MSAADDCWFDHERLEVYREAIAFVAWLSGLLEETVRAGDVKDQLDRASTSIPLNIAEGNGKYSPEGSLPFLRHRAWLRVRMRRRPRHPRGQDQTHARADPSRKRKAPANCEDAHGPHQTKLNPRLRQNHRHLVGPSGPNLNLNLSPNHLPNRNLTLNLTLAFGLFLSSRVCPHPQ